MTQINTGIKISEPGKYSGYSEPLYDGWMRESQFLVVQDGTRLSADIYFPTKDEKKPIEPLPVIWIHTRYYRAFVDSEVGLKTMFDFDPWLNTVIKYGYIIVAVDARGTGGSFGYRYGEFPMQEADDAYDITEWLAEQSWSNGSIGMFGRSYGGITQIMAASRKPPHLKAIFPEMSMFDAYDFIYHGGVFRNDFMKQWADKVNFLDKSFENVPRVDQDLNGNLVKEAVDEHQKNIDPLSLWESMPYRDSRDEKNGELLYSTRSPSNYIDCINESNIAVYILTGWNDIFTRDSILLFSNLIRSKKMVIGPWSHMEQDTEFLAIEHIRWFDYWLKGIQNGIMDEKPILYYTMSHEKEGEWKFTSSWPLSTCEQLDYYFRENISESVKSINDGSLNTLPANDAEAFDTYTVDYTTTSGTSTRWSNGYGGEYNYSDMTENDCKGLTYTSPVLLRDMEITGHPVATVFITSTKKDVTIFAYLEVIDESGHSHYVTEGALNGSHVVTSVAPYNNLNLPYHRGYCEDVRGVDANLSMEFKFDLIPTSMVIKAGHKLRITITCADKDNASTTVSCHPHTLRLFRNVNFASKITLPIVIRE
ncbi:hypothetical protein CN587_27855 [Bacillus wiedmannii]|nr:hypothetical protein CN622_29695 [Bacillus wiedmannii]PEO06289.1 hypothetical protein CN562_29195 [Bacillus wiedmannii]PEQ00758.1 hypothetical protein CN587_27855 [Bacillus wiedmannii]